MSGARTLRLAALAAVMAAAASACATTPPQAVLTAPAGPCDASPDLTGAVMLEAPDNARRPQVVAAQFTGETPCWSGPDGAARPYQLVRLPEMAPGALLTLSASPSSYRLLALDARMLDAEGAQLRSFDREDYAVRGEGYSVQTRMREGERFVLLTVDPSLVGQRIDGVTMGVATSYYTAGYVTSSYSSGSDSEYSRQFSYEGDASVKIQLIE